MPIPVIVWIVAAAIGGVAVGSNWDRIKEWASQTLGYILDGINTAIQVTSDAVVYAVKNVKIPGGIPRFSIKIEVYVQDVRSGKSTLKSEEKEISEDEIPDEFKKQLTTKAKVKMLQQKT
ncbi:hypothetical protein [Aulosira sp. FACHB-615]|uniref:hypothetical protein n=1 Tax=Aulosira sp. FACHB-615 TaxID=2692777 RepID=UPI0016879A66|nr:hypothetical protein [Aulosira sp. FACHB-615]MBD2490649.1 hypothetical protein [Aulosira sp. FACHB-615]